MVDATNAVVTSDILRTELQVVRAEFAQLRAEMRADMCRALWIFGTGIVASLGVIVAVAVANALD